MMKEYNLERTPWEKACKWLFRVIYRFYRPEVGMQKNQSEPTVQILYKWGIVLRDLYVFARKYKKSF